MFYDHYIVAPEHIRQEIEYILGSDSQYEWIKCAFFKYFQDTPKSEIIPGIIREQKCYNDILLLCDTSCPEVSIPEEYSGSIKTHKTENIYDLFAQSQALQEYEDAGSFIVVPGWLEDWQNNLRSIGMYDDNSASSFSELYSSIFILDTGIHSDLIVRAEEFSKFTDVPFKILNAGMGYFSVVFENLILRWSIEKKQKQLKVCQRKAASYAMSIDFIKIIADITDESVEIKSICKSFNTMFAPRNVVYHSFYGDRVEVQYCKTIETKHDVIMKLKDSDESYVVFDTEDGFAIKVSMAGTLFGIIEVQGVAFPENLDEYISVAFDLAKVSGLVISNIRRYQEVVISKEEQVKLTDMLRTTNRILRHDIANNLQVIMGALDLLEETGDEKYLSMIRKASQKGASLIKNVKEIDQISVVDEQLELLNVKNLVDNAISAHAAKFNITGNCLVMADNALSSVFDNIISNALIHGNASKIDIEILNQKGTCEILIADDGIGIPDKEKSRVFDEGYKYGKTGNTGFGLYIAKKTIERYCGSIRVEDNKPSGARFVIELDAASDHKK